MIYKNVNGTQKLVTNIRKPKKWRRLEYLESTGTLWIDSGINPKIKPRVVAKLATLNTTARSYWGNKDSGSSSYSVGFASNKLYYYRYGSATSAPVNYTISQQTIYEWDTSDKVYVNGVLKYTSPNTYTYSASQSNIQIFKAGRNNSPGTFRLYSFKLYDGDSLVRDYVPAEFNGEYGLWDLLHDKFYENKGTGTFIIGPYLDKPYEEIEKLIVPKEANIPKGLEFYTYLQGDGLAYIDTECLLNRNSTISITLQLTSKVNLARYVGVQKSGCYILMYSGDSGNNIKTYTKINAGGTYGTLIAHNTDVHHYYINDSSHKSYCDGTSKVRHSDIPSTDTYYDSCYLFWANGAASGGQSTCRIYSCRIYDNNVLARDLHPCCYLGEPGVWDTVGNKFYGNAGSGNLVLGNKITNDLKEVSTSMPLYDSTIHTEPDGSEWIHIFHHNNPATNLFASTDSFLTQVHKDENRWFDISYCFKLQKYEFLLKQSLTEGGTIYKYRWIQDINPMVAGFNDVPRSKVTYITSTGYTDPSTAYGGLCRGIGSTYLRANNNAGNNWWGAIGAWGLSGGYVPSWNGQLVTTGCIDLYVRKFKIYLEIPIWVLKNALVGDGIAYIDTGLKGNLSTEVNIKITPKSTANMSVFGAASGNNNKCVAIARDSSNSYLFAQFGSIAGTVQLNIVLVADAYYDITLNNTSYIVNGTLARTFSDTNPFTTDNNLLIGKIINFNKSNYTGLVYRCTIKDNGVLVRDFVPATMGGRPGLYDKVNHKMYFNANSSGNFTVE